MSANWNLKLQLSLHTDSSSAQLLREDELARHLQTRMPWLQERVAAKHLRAVSVATESNLADMLTKALGRSKVEEFCAETGQTELHAKTGTRKVKKLKKSSLQLKRWRSNRMMQRSRTSRRMQSLQRSRTSRRMQHCDGCILWIEFGKMVDSGEWTSCGIRRDHEPSDVVVVELRSASEGSESRVNGVATSTSLVARACFLTKQSHHRYSQVVHRTLKLVTH